MTNSEMIINQIDKMLENFGITIARIKLGNAGYTEVEKQYLSVEEMEKDIDNINAEEYVFIFNILENVEQNNSIYLKHNDKLEFIVSLLLEPSTPDLDEFVMALKSIKEKYERK